MPQSIKSTRKENKMPNWCDNSVTITGPKKIIKEIEKTGLKLSKFVPCPEELNDIIAGNAGNNKKEKMIFEQYQHLNAKKYGSKDWYEWNITNWGVKWDIDPDLYVSEDKKTSTIGANFQSAWSSPVKGFKALVTKYPQITLTLEYIEPGCRFAGKYTYSPIEGENEDECEYSSRQELMEFANDTDNDLARNEAEYMEEDEEEEVNAEV